MVELWPQLTHSIIFSQCLGFGFNWNFFWGLSALSSELLLIAWSRVIFTIFLCVLIWSDLIRVISAVRVLTCRSLDQQLLLSSTQFHPWAFDVRSTYIAGGTRNRVRTTARSLWARHSSRTGIHLLSTRTHN